MKNKLQRSKQLWREMDALAHSGACDNMDTVMKFAWLVKKAYDEGLRLLIGYLTTPQGKCQIYTNTDLGRIYIFYTSEEEAKKDLRGGLWEEAYAKDTLNNIFNRKSACGIVFNTKDSMVIIPLVVLELLMPGEKDKPTEFREEYSDEERKAFEAKAKNTVDEKNQHKLWKMVWRENNRLN